MNAKMPELARAFAASGFTEVRTLLSSGNVLFTSSRASEAALQRRAEAAMQVHLSKSFMAFVRPVDTLQALVDADPFAEFDIPAAGKRVVTFLLDEPAKPPRLPLELEGARILAVRGREVFTAYVPGAKGPVFMGLIERTFGKDVTTRTWDTLRKVCNAA